MFAEKDNKVYTVTAEDKGFYIARGYNIVDEDGEVIEYGNGVTPPQEDMTALKDEIEALKAENAALKDEIEALSADKGKAAPKK